VVERSKSGIRFAEIDRVERGGCVNISFEQQLREEFDLPTPIAIWVVITHVFVLSCPLILIWVIDKYASLLPDALANATMVQLASAVYIGATAFEVAQNSADRWYLTVATRSVADLFFNSLMTVAFCMYTIGFYGNTWMSLAAVILTIIYPFAYIRNHPSHGGINGTVVLLATVSFYLLTGDPAVFLFLSGTGLGVYLITFLVKRHAQWLHGWAALVFGLAFVPWPWAIVNAANGETASWGFCVGVTLASGVLAAVLTPFMTKMAPTPRRYGA
jgi:hypothetical protein